MDLCLNGPEEKLEETKYCQPAMFLANCCALEKLRLEKPEVVERCSATAGLSLGECPESLVIYLELNSFYNYFLRYNAICFSGMLSFEECLKVVRVRADAMHEDSFFVLKCECLKESRPGVSACAAGHDLSGWPGPLGPGRPL